MVYHNLWEQKQFFMGAKTVLGIGRGINGREFICSIEIVCKIYEISVVSIV